MSAFVTRDAVLQRRLRTLQPHRARLVVRRAERIHR